MLWKGAPDIYTYIYVCLDMLIALLFNTLHKIGIDIEKSFFGRALIMFWKRTLHIYIYIYICMCVYIYNVYRLGMRENINQPELQQHSSTRSINAATRLVW